MTGVADARAIMLGAVATMNSETLPISRALGRTLAAPVVAQRAQPPFAASAMDGYALRAADTPGRLRVVGESAAGHGYGQELEPGEAVRISTGAPMPAGADAVLIQEEASIEGDALRAAFAAPGRHVRDAGIDFAAGFELLPAGKHLGAIALALAAAGGAARLEVRRRPHVTVLCGGDEVVRPDATPRADQIYDSCSHAIAGLAEEWGAAVTRLDPLPDDAAVIEQAAQQALQSSDLVVFIGSASVGPHDHAKPVFERCGARVLVCKVDMRPGRPTWFATTPRAPVLGLPGNPASAIVAAVLFLRPLIERMLGRSGDVALAKARLLTPLPANGARETYLRARTLEVSGEIWIDASAVQDSSLLSVFVDANALLVRRAQSAADKRGQQVEFLPIQPVTYSWCSAIE